MTTTFPCSQCNFECCGPVPVSNSRARRISALVAEMPAPLRARLSRQKRKLLDCGFIDTERGTCSIYELRPQVCRMFGSVDGMQCPKVHGLVNIVPASTAEAVMGLEYESGVAYLSNSYRWPQ